MLVKLDQSSLTKLGVLIVTSMILIKSAKQTKTKLRTAVVPETNTSQWSKISARCKWFGLTNRESEVTMLLCDHLRRREIADKLFISVRTVDKHIENIFGKTAVTTVTDLIGMVSSITSQET